MNGQRMIYAAIIFILLMAMLAACAGPDSTSGTTCSMYNNPIPHRESAESQPRGNGKVEMVSEPVHEGNYSAKLTIPENYSPGDAARIAIPVDDFTLNDVTSLCYQCYIDADTPINSDGYWVPYFTFEIDTDGKPGCDTWVIGGVGTVQQNTGLWFEISLEGDSLFHVASTISTYESPFPITRMGTLAEIKIAVGPDGNTTLGECPVSKIRLAIGNWGPGGPEGPVICYVDHLICNGEVLF